MAASAAATTTTTTTATPASLDGRVVLVTGASAGIGDATVRLLVANGARVVACARRKEKLDALVAAVGGDAHAVAVQCDVTDADAMKAAVAAGEKWAGKPLDAVVLNSGVMTLGPITDCDVAAWSRMIDVNVKGVLHGVAAVLPGMRERGAGDIIMMSSDAGKKVFPHGGVYCSTKWAVEAITQALRTETADTRIRVTTVQPGATRTELVTPQNNKPQYSEKPPDTASTLAADDIARAVLYCLCQPPDCAVNEIMVAAPASARDGPTDRPTDRPAHAPHGQKTAANSSTRRRGAARRGA
eukprot:CAMPEP_0198329048 /NCGR_PEP_ID=MMETSP1450-20131203/15897_1 /TAXON_ID=753684 ORGANISM="Madagascaria erythrocladiodes, Strain CCMP3234" /NCGR_SAMPLE_ID=MMETSP1450 /ASSEMBLY_ACC=CAM_ASM_001115 /LENGTH=298 /DNA_ID=CAMNT_0044033223 /DNA_START=90 /DNA_END=984 /DNA_ORIENTATION=-